MFESCGSDGVTAGSVRRVGKILAGKEARNMISTIWVTMTSLVGVVMWWGLSLLTRRFAKTTSIVPTAHEKGEPYTAA
jgi:hypothetical protein